MWLADRIIRQVGEMMGFLVRGEDLTASILRWKLLRHFARTRLRKPPPLL